MPAASQRRLTALGTLAGTLLIAWLLWSAGTTSAQVETTTIVGHAQATIMRTETTMDAPLVVGSVALLGAGMGTVIGLLTAPATTREVLPRWRRPARFGTITALLVAVLATGALIATAGGPAPRSARGILSRSSFRAMSGFTAAMQAAGLACNQTRPAEAGGGVADAMLCAVPWEADIRDGHDEVLVALFGSSTDVDGWLGRNVEAGTPVVVGRDWVATCEFRSTCALIGHRLRDVE